MVYRMTIKRGDEPIGELKGREWEGFCKGRGEKDDIEVRSEQVGAGKGSKRTKRYASEGYWRRI